MLQFVNIDVSRLLRFWAVCGVRFADLRRIDRFPTRSGVSGIRFAFSRQ